MLVRCSVCYTASSPINAHKAQPCLRGVWGDILGLEEAWAWRERVEEEVSVTAGGWGRTDASCTQETSKSLSAGTAVHWCIFATSVVLALTH